MKTREDVWEAFADEFLDTQTRTWIPRAALTAIDAGLSRAEAYDVWRFEVTPAVGLNLFDVAGEWAGWSREWLVERVARTRVRPSKVNHVVYRAMVGGFHEWWKAIDACMALMQSSESPRDLAAQLGWLAEHFFDFCPRERAPTSRDALSRLYTMAFLPAFRRLASQSLVTCDSRVTRALAQSNAAGPYRASAS